MNLYYKHLDITLDWIEKTFNKEGASSASFSPIVGWSKPYPETTGYIITTLLNAYSFTKNDKYLHLALRAGRWLLSIQNTNGSFPAGLYNANKINSPSVFNTAQIIDGLVELSIFDKNEIWIKSASKSAIWLADGIDDYGTWSTGHYQANYNPSYYSQVVWPMLRVWKLTNQKNIKDKSEKVLTRICNKTSQSGEIKDWGFKPNSHSFTHTIAYTIRGIIESGIILKEWDKYGTVVEKSIDKFYRLSELNNGKLPGAFNYGWKADRSYTCLTGNVQIAICLMRYEKLFPDLRLVNESAKLVDFVCLKQKNDGYIAGAVGGSFPLWGKYMFMRYPNWAAKYHADALMMIIKRLQSEQKKINE